MARVERPYSNSISMLQVDLRTLRKHFFTFLINRLAKHKPGPLQRTLLSTLSYMG